MLSPSMACGLLSESHARIVRTVVFPRATRERFRNSRQIFQIILIKVNNDNDNNHAISGFFGSDARGHGKTPTGGIHRDTHRQLT